MKIQKLFPILTGTLLLLSACNGVSVVPIENTPQPATATVSTAIPSETATATMTEIATETSIPVTETPTMQATRPAQCSNSAEFVSDVSIPDGTVLPDSSGFVKTWRVKNTGTCTWDSRYILVFTDGTLMMLVDRVPLPASVAPGQSIDLSLDMTSPIYPGAYESDWKFQAPDGSRFGVGKRDSPLWVKIVVGQQEGTSISGFVYQDRNGNSKYDFDDQLIASREVWLQQGGCELGGSRIVNGVSGGDGRYTITGNFSGKYCLSLKRPDETVYTLNVSVTTGQHLDSADMQDAIPNLVISGKVWNDSSQPNGIQQPGEANLPGVTVLLDLGPCDNPISLVPVSVITDAQGNFSFDSLYGGTYCVSIRAGEGGNATILESGTWTTPASGSQQITMRPGEPKSVSFGWQYK